MSTVSKLAIRCVLLFAGSCAVAEAQEFTAHPIDVQAGVPFSQQVASVHGCGAYVYALDSATINWGDGSTSEGGFVGPAYNTALFGSHTYTGTGPFTLSITVNEHCFNNSTSSPKTVSGNSTATSHAAVPVASLEITPNSVQGGQPTYGNVVLANPAPASGTLVALDSLTPKYATVPSSVFIPAGQRTLAAPFVVTTMPVSPSPQKAEISAYSGAGSSMRQLITAVTVK